MPLSKNERKNIVADALVKYVAEYAVKFSHPEVDSSEARQWIGEWMNYLPMSPNGWDDPLGKRSHAGGH